MLKRKLVLEDGHVFEGIGFGSSKEVVANICFNTSVVGYQEIITDPANHGRIICMTYPVIGNYGLNDEDYESKSITVSGLIVREYNDMPSNFRYTHELGEVMDEDGVCGISEVDTRMITQIIRDYGSMKALICDVDKPIEECLNILNEYSEKDLFLEVSTKKIWHSRTTNPLYKIVVVDLGVRKSVIKMLNSIGCNVDVVPYNTSIDTIMKYKPDGIVLSDGPGNPLDCQYAVKLVKELKNKLPILGMGLGCNVIGLAYDANIIKDNAGHNGCNIPVKNLKNNKIQITVQNQMYGLDKENLRDLELTNVNVIDGSVCGIENINDKVIGVTYNPEINDDLENAYNRFIKLIKQARGEANAKKN